MTKNKSKTKYVGIKNLLRFHGYKVSDIYDEWIAHERLTNPDFHYNKDHFYRIARGMNGLTNRKIIDFLTAKLGITTNQLMIHFMKPLPRFEKVKDKKVYDYKASSIQKRIQKEEMERLKELERQKKEGTAPKAFDNIEDTHW